MGVGEGQRDKVGELIGLFIVMFFEEEINEVIKGVLHASKIKK